MNPRKAYQNQHRTNWNRIDMLLALYRNAEESLRRGMDALRRDDSTEFALAQLRTLKLLLAIIDGIDLEQGELSQNVSQLCLFVFEQVSRETLDGLQNGLRVLVTLKESFEAIKVEAQRLEAEGVIPPLDFDLDGTLAVG